MRVSTWHPNSMNFRGATVSSMNFRYVSIHYLISYVIQHLVIRPHLVIKIHNVRANVNAASGLACSNMQLMAYRQFERTIVGTGSFLFTDTAVRFARQSFFL